MNIKDFYDKMANTHKEGWKAAHWASKESQDDNFNLLTQIAPFEQSDRILDVGCGQGDLFGFMKKRGWRAIYEGIDISPKMVDRAWMKYPEGRFACIDFLDKKFNYKYDWILAAGTFNHKVDEDQYEYLDKCIKKMYSLASKGFGMILMSKYDPMQKLNPTDYLFGYDPMKVLDMCFKTTYTLNMNHTALTWGFLVFIYNENWLLN
jgi:2-polyprenyl-3-methyl-5-hydroxy-6-metoxy-1,4-benzoquinol methylase